MFNFVYVFPYMYICFFISKLDIDIFHFAIRIIFNTGHYVNRKYVSFR